MSILIIALITTSGIVLGKMIFKKWMNHLTLYCFIMGGLIFLYELKLLPYIDISPLTWFFIISSYLSFLLGTISVTSARNLYQSNQVCDKKSDISLLIFTDNGKALKYSVILFSIIGLIAAIQRWYVLIDMFGSIPSVLINASAIYSFKVQNEEMTKAFIPILPAFIYVAVFFSGIYTAFRGRFSFLSFFPFIVIIIKQFTDFGRAELLLTLMEFLFTFFLFRYLLNEDLSKRFKFSKKNAIVASIFLFLILIATASFIRFTRGSFENYSGTSPELKQLSENFIISPSIYLYLSSDIGVFSRYVELEKEHNNFGENTFFIFHVFLSKLGVIEKPSFLPPGYHIPMWSNTGTFLREIHADFGTSGVFLVPYLIGLLITWLWFKFYKEKSLIVFAFLVYFYLIVGFSFLTLATKLNQWYISLFIIILYIPVLEKIAYRKKLEIYRKIS